MAFNLFGKKKEEIVSNLKKDLNSSLDEIKEELEDHLGAINENTGEIQSNNHLYGILDAKIDKLKQKVEEIELRISSPKSKDFSVEDPNFSQPLSVPEREVFLVLYTSENSALGYREIAERLNLTETIIKQQVFNLIERGIPIIKEYRHSTAFIRLDKGFKELQAKENVLKIDQTTLQRFQFVD